MFNPFSHHEKQVSKIGTDYGAVGVAHGRGEFAFMPGVDQDLMLAFYQQIAVSDEGATHVLIQDGAGFHLRNGDARLPKNVRILLLPPHCPLLNPVEKLWDQIRDALCNRAIKTMDEPDAVAESWRKDFWANQRRPFSLIRSAWLALKVTVLMGILYLRLYVDGMKRASKILCICRMPLVTTRPRRCRHEI